MLYLLEFVSCAGSLTTGDCSTGAGETSTGSGGEEGTATGALSGTAGTGSACSAGVPVPSLCKSSELSASLWYKA